MYKSKIPIYANWGPSHIRGMQQHLTSAVAEDMGFFREKRLRMSCRIPDFPGSLLTLLYRTTSNALSLNKLLFLVLVKLCIKPSI